MDKVAKRKPIEAFVSPYLTVPPRSLEQALRERESRPASVVDEHSRPDAAAAEQGQP